VPGKIGNENELSAAYNPFAEALMAKTEWEESRAVLRAMLWQAQTIRRNRRTLRSRL
jgi:hypothetical protein